MLASATAQPLPVGTRQVDDVARGGGLAADTVGSGLTPAAKPLTPDLVVSSEGGCILHLTQLRRGFAPPVAAPLARAS